MIHYTVLIPQRNARGAVRRLVPQICQVLGGLLLPYEIICVDDASTDSARGDWEAMLAEFAPLRVLSFDRPRGTSAALTAGIAAARGDLILAMSPEADRAVDVLPHLIARLSHHHLVMARFERSLRAHVCSAPGNALRLLLARPQVLPGEDLCFAARREALSGLPLPRGAFRLLGKLVLERGMRVCELTFSEEHPPRGIEFHTGLAQRLALGWLRRRYEPHLASELTPTTALPHWKFARIEMPRRQVAAAVLVPAKKDPDAA